MEINPFVWERPIEDSDALMGREEFASEAAQLLAGGTHLVLIGPRGTGKTTFTRYQLPQAMRTGVISRQAPTAFVKIDFDNAFSWEAAASAILQAARRVDDRQVKRSMSECLLTLEHESGIELSRGPVKATGGRRTTRGALDQSAHKRVVAALLDAVTAAKVPTVVVIDEFQKIASWRDDDRLEMLATIRSTLMSEGASHISVVFTGSQREGLRLLLENSQAPIFGQTHRIELPQLDVVTVTRHLESESKRAGRPMTYEAAKRITSLTRAHPKRTQQLAWRVWNATTPGREADVEDVVCQYEQLMTSTAGDVAETISALGRFNERLRALLYMIADAEGSGLHSDALCERYGLERGSVGKGLKRLQAMALIEQSSNSVWYLTDPLMHEWLRRSSPYQ